MAEQLDMFIIDRSHAGCERANQANRIVAAADAGLEHRESAVAFLKIQAGQGEHRFEGAKFLTAALRNSGNGRFDPRHQTRQIVIANGNTIDLKPFVETIEMRRGEQSGSLAIGASNS